MDYYIYKNDRNIGPLPENAVISGLRNGDFLRDDLGCRVGETEWKDLSFLFPLETPAPLAPVSQTAYRNSQQLVYQQPPTYQQPSVAYQPALSAGNGSSDVNRLMYFEANKKSAGVAYLLLFFLGGFGAHRFYLGRQGSAVAQIAILWGSIPLMLVFIGFLTIWITPIWLFIDLFLIPQMVSQHNNKLLNGL
jgi:TM2 domain-containing membrane protein YozV